MAAILYSTHEMYLNATSPAPINVTAGNTPNAFQAYRIDFDNCAEDSGSQLRRYETDGSNVHQLHTVHTILQEVCLTHICVNKAGRPIPATLTLETQFTGSTVKRKTSQLAFADLEQSRKTEAGPPLLRNDYMAAQTNKPPVHGKLFTFFGYAPRP